MRQDRAHNIYYIDKAQETMESTFIKHMESVRKDMYEIFSQIPTDKSESKIITIDHEIESLRSQMRELRMKN